MNIRFINLWKYWKHGARDLYLLNIDIDFSGFWYISYFVIFNIGFKISRD
jgi:hypothetical protein